MLKQKSSAPCMADLLLRERHLNRELTLKSIQLEKTIELFNQRLSKLILDKDVLYKELVNVQEELRAHALATDISNLPNELDLFVSAIVPASVSESLYTEIDTRSAISHCTVAEDLAFDKALREEKILTSIAPLVAKPSGQGTLVVLPPHRTSPHGAFIPMGKDSLPARKPAAACFSVCESLNRMDVGRCVVSKAIFAKGDTLFVEHPFFTVCAKSARSLLPVDYRNVLDLVLGKHDVFAAQGWDPRLATALIVYLCALNRGESPSLRSSLNSLCCPLQSIDGSILASFCEFAHFVHSAFPSSLIENVTEDDIVSFFITFQTNAISHGSAFAVNDSFVEVAVSGEEKYSLFEFSSLMEHSCAPNVVVCVRSRTDLDISNTDDYVLEARAIRDIGVGECLSISYCNLLPPTAQRRKVLKSKYFFDCLCSRCTSGIDYSRHCVTSDGMSVSPIGDGSRWSAQTGLISATEAIILGFVTAEVRFLKASSSVTSWTDFVLSYLEAHALGTACLSPDHYAVVTAFCLMLSQSSGHVAAPEPAWDAVCSYFKALTKLFFSGQPKAFMDLHDVSPRHVSELDLSQFSYEHSVVLLPVCEAVALATHNTKVSECMWYFAHRLISGVAFQSTGSRALRAQLMCASLLV